jgi:hypothetical protein
MTDSLICGRALNRAARRAAAVRICNQDFSLLIIASVIRLLGGPIVPREAGAEGRLPVCGFPLQLTPSANRHQDAR